MRFSLYLTVLPLVCSTSLSPGRVSKKSEFDLALATVVGTPNESLESVQSILGHAETVSDTRLLAKIKDPEVFQAILSRLDCEEAVLAPALMTTIRQQFASSQGNIPPGSAGHKIIEVCLQNLLKMSNSHRYFESLQPLLYHICTRGHIELLRTFLAYGVDLIPIGVAEIKQNLMPMIEFLLHHGIRLEGQVYQVIRLLRNPEFTVGGFQLLLGNGLPWKMTDRNSNWLIEALRAGRLDIGHFMYQKGMKLPSLFANGTSKTLHAHGFKATPMQLAWYIVSKEGTARLFEKYRVLLEGILGPDSALSEVNKDVLGEMMSWMLSHEAEKIHKELFDNL